MFGIFTNQKGSAPLLVVLMLLVGVGAAVYLSQKPTDLKPSADVIVQSKEASMTLVNMGSNSPLIGDKVNVEVRVRSDFETVKQIIATLIYDRSALEFVSGNLVNDNPKKVLKVESLLKNKDNKNILLDTRLKVLR